MRSKFVAFVSLVTVVAGCADPGGDVGTVLSESTGPPVDASTGSVTGIVVDDEQRPIPDAEVALVSKDLVTNRSAITGEDGRFSFLKLPVGTYQVAINAIFFRESLQKVDVIADEVAALTIQMVDVVKSELLVELFPYKGHINCSVHSLGAYGPFNLCQGLAEDASRFPLPIREDLPLRGIVLEAVWSPGTPATGTDLEIALCNKKDEVQDPVNCRETTGDGYRESVRGKSPLVLRAQDLPLAEYPEMETFVGDGGQTSARVPVTFQQSFDLWMSLCYVDYCDELYSARPPE